MKPNAPGLRPACLAALLLTVACDSPTTPRVDPCTTSNGIAIGQTVSGILAASDCRLADGSYADRWQLVVGAATPVRIDLTSASFDAYLLLTDAGGTVLEENDDGGGGTNARIGRIMQPGTYYLVANSFGAGETGPYQLTVTSVANDPCLAAQAIALGQTVSGTLSGGDCELPDGTFIDLYELTITATTTVRIDLRSNAFDAYLFLTDPALNVIFEDDDSGGGTDARIQLLLHPGRFLIVANSFAPATGPYQLSVQAVAADLAGPDASAPPEGAGKAAGAPKALRPGA